MHRISSIIKGAVVALGLVLCAQMARAQEPDEAEKPKPAARGVPAISEPDSSVQDSTVLDTTSAWRPDSTPLTGLQTPTLGNPDLRHSYWVPGLQYGATIQSRPLSGDSTQGWYTTNYVGASLSLFKGWSKSQFALNYSGGGAFTTQTGESNGTYQQLGVGQNIQGRRWQLQWTDQFSYLPQTQFGFGASTSLSLPGIGGPLGPSSGGLGGSTVPSQSIYAAIGPRYSNAAVVQVTYALSSRQSLTAAGSYGLLRFTQSGNVDTDNIIGSFGYNYALTPKDSIGVVYRFTAYHYAGEPQALGDTTVSIAYGRKITQRFALQLFAGPEYTTYRVPIGTTTSRMSGAASVSLTYGLRQGGLNLNYTHGLGGGSGVLVGSEMDQLLFGASHRLTRAWNINGSLGFASNRSLANSSSTTANNVSYKAWYLGGGVSRPIGRNVDFSASYTASISEPNQPGCIGLNCNASTTQHSITVFLQWHTRPFVIE